MDFRKRQLPPLPATRRLEHHIPGALDASEPAIDITEPSPELEPPQPVAVEPVDVILPNSEPQRYRLRHIVKRPGVDGQPPHLEDQPVAGTLTTAIRDGKPQQLRYRRRGKGGEVVVDATLAMFPPGAPRIPLEESQEAESQLSWAFLIAQKKVPEREATAQDDTSDAKKNPREGTDIRPLLEKYPAGQFELIIEATGVPPDKLKELQAKTREKKHTATHTWGEDAEVQILEAQHTELLRAGGSALVRQAVVVGAPEENLATVASIVAEQVLPGEDTLWSFEKDKGTIKVFPSEKAALEASAKAALEAYAKAELEASAKDFSLSAFMSAEAHARFIRITNGQEFPGLPIVEQQDFGTNREVSTSADKIPLTNILDNYGNVTGRLEVTEQEFARHTFLLAASGGGKTEMTKQVIVNGAVAEYERFKRGETATLRGNLLVDGAKDGNYDDLSARLRAAGLPEEMCTIHKVSLNTLVAANVAFLRLTDTKPTTQITSAAQTFANSYQDPEARRVISKYLAAGMSEGAEQLGWNLLTNKSNYKYDPRMPNMSEVPKYTLEHLENSRYKGDTKQDLGTFAETEIRKHLGGAAGAFFAGGYLLDPMKIINNPGITLIELGGAEDATAQAMLLTGILRGVSAALEALKTTPGDVEETRLRIFVDEPGRIFGNDDVGEANAHYLTHIRGRGGSVLIAKQDTNDIHPSVLSNVGNLLVGRTSNVDDMELFAKRMGCEAQDLRFLLSCDPGHGVYYGGGMPRPVRIASTNPKDIPKGEGKVVGPESLLDLDGDRRFYSRDTMAEAKKMLVEDSEGIRTWAELAVIQMAMGRPVPEFNGELRQQYDSLPPSEKEAFDCAVDHAIKHSVDSRPFLLDIAPRRAYIDYLTGHADAQFTAKEPADYSPLELSLPAGRYSRTIDALTAMTTPPLPEGYMEPYNEALGVKDSTDPRAKPRITGRNIRQLLQNVNSLEQQSYQRLMMAIDGASRVEQGKAVPAKIIEAFEAEFIKHGDKKEDRTAGILDHILKTTTGLTPKHIEAYRKLATHANAGLSALKPEEQPPTYQELATGLTAILQAHRKEVKRLDQLANVPGDTAYDQLRVLLEVQDATMSGISPANIFFAPDLLQPGFTFDNTVASALKRSDALSGSIYDAQRRLHNYGQLPSPTYLDLVRTDNTDLRKRWLNQASRVFFATYGMSDEESEALAAQFTRVTQNLLGQHEQQRQREQQKRAGA